MKYIPTIGLEVHTELATASKMFCSCKNDTDEEKPNVNVCPICLGHPGTLPVMNRKAVENVLKLGYALKGTIAKTAHFDRKSYFYPDLPKGYQISQYEEPLVQKGELHGIRVRRIHLEEDTGRLLHELPGEHTEKKPVRQAQGKASFVDFNRAGVPLMELVTEPDIKDGAMAVAFAKELQLILRYLDISRADMEKGEMRVEANISIAPEGRKELGTKVEVKNLNSFRAVQEAIDYELNRQKRVLDGGSNVEQETRGWNEKKKTTESQRSKESAHDYRYFPEPDLPTLVLGEAFSLEELQKSTPELPEEKRKRFRKVFCLDENQINFLAENQKEAIFFEEAVSELRTRIEPPPIPLLYNYFSSDLQGMVKKSGRAFSGIKINPEHFAHLIALIHGEKLSSRLAKNVLEQMFETGSDPETIINESGVQIVSDVKELEKIAADIIRNNAKVAEDFKKGKENALQFLVGQGMARTKGQADPNELRRIFQKLLSES